MVLRYSLQMSIHSCSFFGFTESSHVADTINCNKRVNTIDKFIILVAIDVNYDDDDDITKFSSDYFYSYNFE
jgi:hypothetical protein